MPNDEIVDSSSTNETETVDAAAETAETTDQPNNEEESASSETSESTTTTRENGKPASDAGKKTAKDSNPAEKRIKQLLGEIKQLKRQIAPPAAKADAKPLEEPVKPKLDDFPSYDDYEKANDAYVRSLAKYEVAKERQARDDESRKSARAEADRQAQAAWTERSKATLERHPDFDVKQAILDVDPTPAMDGFIVRSKIGPDVLKHLQDNPEDADRIRDLDDPYEVASELRDIERDLSATIKGTARKPGPKVPSLVTGGGAAPVKERSVGDVLYGGK